MEKQNM